MHGAHARALGLFGPQRHRRLASIQVPTSSHAWGQLSHAQVWVLSLGDDLHAQPAEAGDEPAPGRTYAAPQRALLDALARLGCHVTSFLPPAAWQLIVPDGADLHALAEEFPTVRMAPLEADLKVAPELRDVAAVLRARPGLLRDHLLAEREGSTDHGSDEEVRLLRALDIQWRGAPPEAVAHLVVEVHFPDLGLQPAGGQEQASSSCAEPAQQTQRLQAAQQAGMHAPRACTPAPAAAAAQDWVLPLSQVVPSGSSAAACRPRLSVQAGNPNVLLVALCPEALDATVGWLARAPQVAWLAPRVRARLHNLVASAIVQEGATVTVTRDGATVLAAHPFWAAGLDGKGQVIGCGDSGLDVQHCMFYDPAVDFLSNVRTESSGVMSFRSSTHRKLVLYMGLQDLVDGYGHGTHVTGTLAGSRFDRAPLSPDPLDPGTGQAPAAKVAFLDLSRDRSDAVWTPGDLGRSYFNLTYAAGARVHSDSWGSELTVYDGMAAAVDRFTWNRQDFVSVFAAGNYGASSATTTVTSPAVAKNCITVGATPSVTRQTSLGPADIRLLNLTATITLPGGQVSARSVRVVVSAISRDTSAVVGQNLPLAQALPEDACSSLSNAGQLRGSAVLVKRGGCYFTDKMRLVAAAGATAIIVYNDRQDGYFLMQASDGAAVGATIPMMGVPASTGAWLKQALASGSDVQVALRQAGSGVGLAGYEDVASFSSFGPTADGRTKPDLVAPAFLYSAAATNTPLGEGVPPACGRDGMLKLLQGTSMATPVVAGSATLVRQYFMDGYYPDGRPSEAAKRMPSGPLIKAILLGGASHMQGIVTTTGLPLEDAPSQRQGYGRLDLMRALPLPNSPLGWRLQVADVTDNAGLVQDGEHRYCVRALGGPLRITIAWYDWPGDPAAGSALVNNLDLTVRAAGRGGMVDYGNGAPDAANNVEQVWYDALSFGDVAITVTAKTIYARAARQPYALVVQGMFSGTLQAPGNGTAGAGGSCVVQVAVIDAALSTISKRDAKFYFRTQAGASPPNGFECWLSFDTAAATSNGTDAQDWQPCSSPKLYSSLADGRYSFQVRVKDETVPTVLPFLIDATPPVTTLLSSLPAGSASEPPATAWDNATFSFTAQDASANITFRCSIAYWTDGAAPAPAPPALHLTGGAALSALRPIGPDGAAAPGALALVVGDGTGWQVCGSPLEVGGLRWGNYRLLVRAVDESNNMEPQPKAAEWRVRYAPSERYVRAAAAPRIVRSLALPLSLAAFTGAPDLAQPPLAAPLAGSALEYALLAGSSLGGTWATDGVQWRSATVSASGTLQVEASADGDYLAVVRPPASTNPVTWAEASIMMDTTPPVVNINQAKVPSAMQSDPRVTIEFSGAVDGEVWRFLCRWLGPAPQAVDPNTPDAGATAFNADCGQHSSVHDMQEGYWLFQVKGEDLAGNVGQAASVSFRTDLSPPNMTAQVPAATVLHKLVIPYSVDDGPTGTGVASTNCSLRWTSLVDTINIAAGDAEYPAAQSPPEWASPCPSPAAKYTVQEGSYVWSIQAVDGAGLRVAGDYVIVVDNTPPISKVFAAPLASGMSLPSRVSISFASSDKPDSSPSGIQRTECLLDKVQAPPPPNNPPPPPSNSPPPPGPIPAGTASVGSPGHASRMLRQSTAADGGEDAAGILAALAGRRRLQQADVDPSSTTYINGTALRFGEWLPCGGNSSQAVVVYAGLTTGHYALRVRAWDTAGNLGAPSDAYFFPVDASLPLDGSVPVSTDSGDDDTTKMIVIGVLCGVGGLLLIALVVGLVVARRRAVRRRYAAPPPPHMNGVEIGGYSAPVTNGNGHAGSFTPLPMATGTAIGAPVVTGPYPAINGNGAANGTVAGMPVPAAYDPALAAALAVSAEEARRQQAARAQGTGGGAPLGTAAGAPAWDEEERVRRALAASIEEENMRRAVQASLQAAEQASIQRSAAEREQDMINRAIAASLQTAQAAPKR